MYGHITNIVGHLLHFNFYSIPAVWENFKNFKTSIKKFKYLTFDFDSLYLFLKKIPIGYDYEYRFVVMFKRNL